ncbi:uncharacterized protein LOC131146450 [Malania oleifera]|uniref:uncharacterized protein LOC131146450 n=1 Tax=Malania oleifera TaxID=397392 RepID=UPI0025AE50A3|nr:uncharacterized protein LOC131146450 [Malania oleifera]XP_057952056.1 uncharacterized protein LOC131146450 [Malania oleifera]
MVPPYGLQLASDLISSNFGDLVAKVCSCLLRRGTLPLTSIIQYTGLPRDKVMNSLLVLIQHNCVQAFAQEQPGGFGEAPKVQTQYMVLFDNIIHRMRFPKFLAIVTRELDDQCQKVLESLLQHGRLTLSQIYDRAKSHRNEENCAAQDALRESLLKLLHVHFVERCPAGEPFLSLPTEDEETPAKKRGTKSAKIIEEFDTTERRALTAAVPMEAMRFSLITNTAIDDTEKSEDNSPGGITVGEKRKHNALESDRGIEASESEREILWRPNFEEFVRRLRHKACIENVRIQTGDAAATILTAILEATRSAETKVKTERTVPLSLDNIFEEVMKSEAGRSMTMGHVDACLGEIDGHPGGRGTDDLRSIDLKKIIHVAQNAEVESIVLKRYGRDAYRIFRFLSRASRLIETDKISDTTFVEKKDTAKILHKLWKNDYVHMEKVLVHGSRQSQIVLWKVNKRTLWEHVLDEMYHAALNLRKRVAYEVEKEKELLQLPKDSRTELQEKRHKRLTEIRVLLGSSLLKLDDAIMLFHDF